MSALDSLLARFEANATQARADILIADSSSEGRLAGEADAWDGAARWVREEIAAGIEATA